MRALTVFAGLAIICLMSGPVVAANGTPDGVKVVCPEDHEVVLRILGIALGKLVPQDAEGEIFSNEPYSGHNALEGDNWHWSEEDKCYARVGPNGRPRRLVAQTNGDWVMYEYQDSYNGGTMVWNPAGAGQSETRPQAA